MTLHRLTAFLAVLLISLSSFAAEIAPHHALVKVLGKSQAHLRELYKLNLDFFPPSKNGDILVAALPEDLQLLERNGYRFEVVHMDLEDFYARRARDEGSLDDMGGYRTYTEINAKLDSMHTAYPTITTAKFSIGNSLNGNPMWCLKISDNPDVDEDEIELCYNSLIHAREPEAMEVLIYFMDHLLSNYGSDTEITDLVDNREFFFIPCMNPDGYLYNESTNPGGGGLWRKNRRNNGGSFGVDLNRNFGFNWGWDDVGSSGTPSSQTYRGTAGFSEPETQVYRNFMESRNFIVSMNYHTYSNLVLCPWGSSDYQSGYTPEHTTFMTMLDSMQYYIQQVNGATYAIGPPWEILYEVNGDCNDWCYGEQTTKDRVFGITTEVGGDNDGFWPPPSRIIPLAAENLPSNMFVARYSAILAPQDQAMEIIESSQSESSGDGDGVVEPGEDLALSIDLQNTGLLSLTGLSGVLSETDPDVTVTNSVVNWADLAPDDHATGMSNFVATISLSCPNPHGIAFSLHLTATSGLDTTVAIGAVVGQPVFADDIEGGTNGWTHGGTGDQWHISTRRANSPTHSWYCGSETGGTYNNNIHAILTSPSFLVGDGSVLSFKHWYQLETDHDFGYVEINDGNGWSLLSGPYSGQSADWEPVQVPLSGVAAGSTVQIRFRMTTDAVVFQEGWYLDDIGVSPPPNIVVTPSSIEIGLDDGEIDHRHVVIQNNGSADLNYTTGFANGAQADTSAPDAYGYRWQDSDGPCGPVYQWLPIGALGQQLIFTTGQGDQVRGPFELGFEFPFYGKMYHQIWISANGWISFEDSTTTLEFNESLPSLVAPAAAILAWWDDLKPQDAGANVRFWTNNLDSAAAHYENIHAGSPPNQGVYNFQILITPRGEAKVFYGNMGTLRLASATIGIQNQNKSVGLTVLNNTAGIGNFEARRFAMGPRWVSVLPVAGSVATGESDTLDLLFDENFFCAVPSLSALHVRSNDPDNPIVVVPLTATIAVILEAPTDLTIQVNGDDIQLDWNPSVGATQYFIEIATNSDGPFSILDIVPTDSYTHVNGVNYGESVFYHVRAVN